MDIDDFNVSEEEKAEVVFEIGGLKFVDASGENLPRELIEHLVESLVEVGALIRDPETGTLKPNQDQLPDGVISGVELEVDDEGDLTSCRQLSADEIPPELRKQ